jgi:2-iminobutanoate/2-iminopropanoate deaminase
LYHAWKSLPKHAIDNFDKVWYNTPNNTKEDLMLTTITAPHAPAAIGPYSQAIAANGFLYLSGQIPLVPDTGELLLGDVAAQTEQVVQNIAAVLSAGGSDFQHIIKTTCFLQNMSDFAEFNAVYEKHFISKPARSCVAVAALPKGALVEIEVIAAIISKGVLQ